MIDLTNLFQDQRWRRYRTERTSPHALYVATINGGKVAVIVVRRTRSDGDWALSATALDYVAEGVRDGRLASAHIVLANKWTVAEHAEVTEVRARIGDTEPNDGPWGPYFWLDGGLKPVADYRSAVDDDEPFGCQPFASTVIG
jgi:hypothetical protein